MAQARMDFQSNPLHKFCTKTNSTVQLELQRCIAVVVVVAVLAGQMQKPFYELSKRICGVKIREKPRF